MRQFACPYFRQGVELTDERERHIEETHPGTLSVYLQQLAETPTSPDQVRQSNRDDSAFLFSKWFATIRTGRHFVVVTVKQNDPERYWIITAYTTRKISGGIAIWKRT